MALSVSCTCCALVRVSAECCRYLSYPSAVKRLWPLWSNPVPLSLIQCTCVVPLFLRCCVIYHMVLIAQCGKVLWLPLRSYHLDNWISQFRFDNLAPIWYPRTTFGTIPTTALISKGFDTTDILLNEASMVQTKEPEPTPTNMPVMPVTVDPKMPPEDQLDSVVTIH